MLDAALLRNDLDAVILGLSKRGVTFDRETYLQLEGERRRVIQEAEALKAERNRVSDEVARLKRAKENADALIAAQREVGERLKALEAEEKEAEAGFRSFLATLPNLPHESVPVGRDENQTCPLPVSTTCHEAGCRQSHDGTRRARPSEQNAPAPHAVRAMPARRAMPDRPRDAVLYSSVRWKQGSRA